MKFVPQPWHLLACVVAGYANQEQQRTIDYIRTKNADSGYSGRKFDRTPPRRSYPAPGAEWRQVTTVFVRGTCRHSSEGENAGSSGVIPSSNSK